MSKLVLIGGPPGVGKTTVLPHVQDAFEHCAVLDADDVRRMRPLPGTDEAAGAIGVRNVISVVGGFLEAGFPFVFLAWVLANPALIERILTGLDGRYESTLILHLVASPEALEARIGERAGREDRLEYALAKLRQIDALPYAKIDTTGLGSEAVADRIAAEVRAS